MKEMQAVFMKVVTKT